MKWRVLRLADGLGEFAEAWDALNLRLFGGHPLLDATFVAGLLRSFGDGRQHLCVLERDAEPLGMCILQRGRFGVWRSFLPSQAQIAPTLLADAAGLQRLFAALPDGANAIELLCHDPRYGSLHVESPVPMRTARHAVTIAIPLQGGFEAYWQRRSKKLRDNLRRYARRAESSGLALEHRILDGVSDMSAAVRRYADLEGRGWKGQQGTALGSDPAQLGFYEALMLAHANRGQAMVYELWAGNRLAASRLVVAQGGLVVALKTTHDEDLRDWAPGRLLLRAVIEDAFTRWPASRLEFYTNATVDQMAWADEQRTIVHVSCYRDRARETLATLRHSLRNHAARSAVSGDEAYAIDVVEICTDATKLPAGEAGLMARSEAQDVQFGRDWFDLFMRTVTPHSEKSSLLLLRRGGFPVAVLPVNLDPALKRVGGSVGALTNYYTTLYSPALAPDTVGVDLLPLLQAVRAQGQNPPSLVFAPMDPDGQGYKVLRSGLLAGGYAVFDYFAHGNWYLPVTGSWEQYFQARPGALRNTVQRMSRKLVAGGGRIEVITAAEDLPRGIAAYETVYARSWKRPEAVPEFVRELASLSARRGWLRLGVVWLGDAPIAAQLWIVANGRASIYKLAYDEAHKHLAPGTVLSAHLMQAAIETDHVTEVDYLVGDDPYKRDWMTHRRERHGLVAYDLSTWTGRLMALRASASTVLRRWGRQSPRPTGRAADRRR